MTADQNGPKPDAEREGPSISEREKRLIPIADPAVLDMLADEVGRLAGAEPGERLVVLIDSHTAHQIDTADAARVVADRAYLVGKAPHGWTAATNVVSLDYTQDLPEGERFFIVLSTTLSLAVVGREMEPSETAEQVFKGGWTDVRSCVEMIARELLHKAGGEAPEFPKQDIEAAGQDFSRASQLMANLTENLTAMQRGVAMDKHDLYSVLEILKAISSKRRSHDVLFIFVEQIARIVDVHRCSVVRVLGSTETGHVIASHDDSRLSDLIIDLSRYPELTHAMDTCNKVVINRVDQDPLTQEYASDLRHAQVRSLLVIPIVMFDPNVGSLLLRVARSDRPFTLREIGFCEIVAEAASTALERAYLFESLQTANERFEHLAVTDGLTGLKNHRYFRERLEYELDRASRYKLPLALVVFDVDNFKSLNDAFGHLLGDSVLEEMARRIERVTRKSDIVARYGGEEFTVIMPQTGLDGGRAQAERIRRIISEQPYPGITGDRPVTVSIGLAVLDHDSMLDSEALIRAADSALYEAKRQGKNRVVVGSHQGGGS